MLFDRYLSYGIVKWWDKEQKYFVSVICKVMFRTAASIEKLFLFPFFFGTVSWKSLFWTCNRKKKIPSELPIFSAIYTAQHSIPSIKLIPISKLDTEYVQLNFPLNFLSNWEVDTQLKLQYPDRWMRNVDLLFFLFLHVAIVSIQVWDLKFMLYSQVSIVVMGRG